MIALLLVACGTGDPTEGDDPTTPHSTDTGAAQETGLVTDAFTIGPDGGTIDAGGLVLTVPPGAVADDIEFVVIDTGDLPPSPYLGLSNVWEIQPSNIVFDVPVELSIAYAGRAPAALYWGTIGSWDLVEDAADTGSRLSGTISRTGSGFVSQSLGASETWTYTAPELDVLFVVDNSCSMIEEQEELADAFPLMLDMLWDEGVDFHAGVITTDMDSSSDQGKLQQVTGLSWVDLDTADPISVFTNLAIQGTSGSATERGRDAVYAAIVTHGAGANNGFLRPDADLAVVVLSDEDDASVDLSVAEYADYLLGYHKDPGRVRHESIVHLTNPGALSGESRGTDYLQATDLVGGASIEIDGKAYASAVQDAIDNLPQPTFLLADPADPDTVVVIATEPSEVPVTLGALDFHYDDKADAVILDDYRPPTDTVLKITYDLL